MTKNWLIVANAARARVFEDDADGGKLTTLADLVHTASRQKGIELAGDRAGHLEGQGHGLGSSSYAPRMEVREREHEHFAREVATMLNEAIAAGRCGGLVLVASNPFLGHLKSHLGTQATRALLRTVAADYTTLREDEIVRRVHAEPAL